ncbi:MAG: ATP-binding protein [Anaerolineae bacterium]|jgi:C4-dicarboxylate-specific signal transduction histidine kinase|nr:ATP-binding protein [Anaerolineae bacterium]
MNDYKPYLEKARQASIDENYKAAEDFYRQVWEIIRPSADSAMIGVVAGEYAKTLRQQGKENLDLLKEAFTRVPPEKRNFTLNFEYAMALRRRAEFAEALTILDNLKADERERGDVLDQKARCLLGLGRFDEAYELSINNLQKNKNSEYTIGMLKQIYELAKQQQTELETSRRLSALGMMATGVAHELNQPIGVIRAATTAALSDLKDDLFRLDELEPLLNRILAQSDRLHRIIQRFRERIRGDRTAYQIVNLNALIQQTLQTSFEAQFKAHAIALEMDFDPHDPKALVNPYQLEEVIINLLANARDALENRPNAKVNIRTRLKPNNWSEIRITDNGPGLSEDYQRHLFQPFYSTKSTEKGTGIGLYLAYEMVKSFGGQLRYDDQYRSGARFIIELPPINQA